MSAAERPLLAVRDLEKTFHGSDGARTVLAGLSLDIGERDLVAIVGESGCGKTTLLRMLAGLESPTAGRILLEDRLVTGPEPRICLVFQQYGATLLPWKRALDNVLFGLPRAGAAGRAARAAGLALLDRMGLADAVGRYPWELSGGMQQRVALARALIRNPRVLLLDEPFSAVDEATRAGLQTLLRALHRDETCSIVLVSHNLDDVRSLARRAIVLAGRPARVEQVLEHPGQLTREALRRHLAPRPRRMA